MIGVKINGGIGDQLFQYATARALSLRLKTDLVLDFTKLGNQTLWLNYFNAINQTAASILTMNQVVASENEFNRNVVTSPDNSCLDGVFPFEDYFLDKADVIRRDLTPKSSMSPENARLENEIHAERTPVSIHIPRYEREEDNLPMKYYERCMEVLKPNFSNLSLYVFTNDVPFCIQNVKFAIPTRFIDASSTPNEEIFLMSLCRHHIISTEKSSWWGAWLDRRDSKFVFAPHTYLKSALGPRAIQQIPDRWMTITF